MTDITSDDRAFAVKFLTTLGFPQYASTVSGEEAFGDSLGEKALAELVAYRRACNQRAATTLKPILKEINRLEKEYGFDRPAHQYQCMMIELQDLIKARAAIMELGDDAD